MRRYRFPFLLRLGVYGIGAVHGARADADEHAVKGFHAGFLIDFLKKSVLGGHVAPGQDDQPGVLHQICG